MEVKPDAGHSKYMYLGQLFEGAEAIQFFQKGIELMVKEREAQSAQEVQYKLNDYGQKLKKYFFLLKYSFNRFVIEVIV